MAVAGTASSTTFLCLHLITAPDFFPGTKPPRIRLHSPVFLAAGWEPILWILRHLTIQGIQEFKRNRVKYNPPKGDLVEIGHPQGFLKP